MRLRDIPEDFQRILKWAMDGKEVLDIRYQDHRGFPAVVTAYVHDAKGERLWLVTEDDNDLIFGYEFLLDLTAAAA